MLNHNKCKKFGNECMIDGFGANVCANCQFFLSHKVLSTFLDTEGSIDDSNEPKRSVQGFYVTTWTSFVTQDFASNCTFG